MKLVLTMVILLLDATLAHAQLVSSVLPSSRAVQVGSTATAFATIINTGSTTAVGCSIAPVATTPPLPVTFHYQTTNPATNALTGTPDTPVNIPGGNGVQTFVIAFTPTDVIPVTDVKLNFSCTNTQPAQIITGVNTLQLFASSDPVPDIVALAATVSGNGIVTVGPAGGAFAVAAVNVGADGLIVATADTGSTSLPQLTIRICQTNASTGTCVADPATSQLVEMGPGSTTTFAVFVSASSTVPFDPATNRIFVKFREFTGGARGATSVAVRTP